MNIEVSIGEAVDKYSILEIKLKRILEKEKQIEINKELLALNQCKSYILQHSSYYKLLVYVNEQIWDMTNIIKSIQPDHPDFSSIANNIFEFNQKRFRLKNKFNLLSSSNIKEQKSYSSNTCKLLIDSIETIYNKIAEINFLLLEYDCIFVEQSFYDIMKSIFSNIQLSVNNEMKIIILNDIVIDPYLITLFDFDPIRYICS